MSSDRADEESIPELETLDIEMRRLEVEKLRAEIEQVRLAWWKRPGYLGGLVPIVIAIVGFSSAWISGYFDTQRQILKSEISDLEAKSDRLTTSNQEMETANQEMKAANQEIQRKIDYAYLKLKVASYAASYAMSHIQGFRSYENSREKLKAASGGLEPDIANAINDLIEQLEFIDVIVEITDTDIEKLLDTLKEIPASEWAVELYYAPVADQNILIAPDGRLYHIERQKYYTREEFDRILEAESSN